MRTRARAVVYNPSMPFDSMRSASIPFILKMRKTKGSSLKKTNEVAGSTARTPLNEPSILPHACIILSNHALP